MKLHGGYTPRVAGRPLKGIGKICLPGTLSLSLLRHGERYASVVRNGQHVQFGDALAELSTASGILVLPSPVTGVVHLKDPDDDSPSHLALEVTDPNVRSIDRKVLEPARLGAEEMRMKLARGGIWPFFWSSRTLGIPAMTGEEQPRAIIVNCIKTEPFRARGKVILQRDWSSVIEGIRFLPRLMQDYGRVEIVLTEERDPVARAMRQQLAGSAWVRFHAVPLAYPVENPRILNAAMRDHDHSIAKDDQLWIIDVQGVAALGSFLMRGTPSHV